MYLIQPMKRLLILLCLAGVLSGCETSDPAYQWLQYQSGMISEIPETPEPIEFQFFFSPSSGDAQWFFDELDINGNVNISSRLAYLFYPTLDPEIRILNQSGSGDILNGVITQSDGDQIRGTYYIDPGNYFILHVHTNYQDAPYYFQVTLRRFRDAGTYTYVWANINSTVEPPIADAGNDQIIGSYGQVIQLDSSASYSPTGLNIDKYYWTLTTPEGSAAALDDPHAAFPTFIADLYGEYLATLVVVDEQGTPSATDEVLYSLTNLPPAAEAGDNLAAIVGDILVLNGSGTDPENTPLTYSWNLTSFPDGSLTELLDSNTATPTLTIDLPGTYTVSLVVNDGELSSEADTATIEAISVQDAITSTLLQLSTTLNQLSDDQVLHRRQVHVLTRTLNRILSAIEAEQYEKALAKLKREILPRLNGCTDNEKADRNDWVKDCSVQTELYESFSEVEYLLEERLGITVHRQHRNRQHCDNRIGRYGSKECYPGSPRGRHHSRR